MIGISFHASWYLVPRAPAAFSAAAGSFVGLCCHNVFPTVLDAQIQSLKSFEGQKWTKHLAPGNAHLYSPRNVLPSTPRTAIEIP